MSLILNILFSVTWKLNLVEVNGLNYINSEETNKIVDDSETGRNFTIVGDQFMRDGTPYQIISGSLHYFRVPSEYWRDRLLKLKAVGANTVSTYIEWSTHEPEERQYMFEEEGDIKRFMKLAAELDLLVVMRFGPYINSERDMGGFPYWLMSKYPDIKLRTTDKNFMNEIKIWLAKLFSILGPSLYGRGGPIILVQVENEYSMASPCDKNYKEMLRDMVLEHVGKNAILHTADPSYYGCGAVNGTLTTTNGADIKAQFHELRKFMKHGPLMDSEFYTGWLNHWGYNPNTKNTNGIIEGLKYVMENKGHVNMYVLIGGTNFGFSAGANKDNYYYQPVTTSYDFGAPVSEGGNMKSIYWDIRNFMKKYIPELEHIKPPNATEKAAYGNVTLSGVVNLLSAKGRSKLGKRYGDVTGAVLPTFEKLRQRAGLMLYETKLGLVGHGTLEILKPRDRVYIYIDGQHTGVIDREHKHFNLTIVSNASSTLSLLVENQGRLCFSQYAQADLMDFKGILGNVTFNKKTLNGKWNITGYPLDKMDRNDSAEMFKQLNTSRGPVLYTGVLSLPNNKKQLDTFLDTSGWGKGFAWVNGRNLGRYWPGRGPLVTLYVPGVWLCARNTVQLLELERPRADLTVQFIDRRTSTEEKKSQDNKLQDKLIILF